MHPLVVYNEWLRGLNIFLYIIIIEVINNAYLRGAWSISIYFFYGLFSPKTP